VARLQFNRRSEKNGMLLTLLSAPLVLAARPAVLAASALRQAVRATRQVEQRLSSQTAGFARATGRIADLEAEADRLRAALERREGEAKVYDKKVAEFAKLMADEALDVCVNGLGIFFFFFFFLEIY
jgi:septal ring factor EnvC (AmiA/AmiB activator)